MKPGMVAEFASAEAATLAARRLREQGYRDVEAYTPYEVHELSEAVGAERPRVIPRVVLVAAVLAATAAYLVIWWTNGVDYPLDVGGRPLNSVPADVPIMFETTVLVAAATAFALVFFLSGMPRLEPPIADVDGHEAVSADRFWIAVTTVDPVLDPAIVDELVALGATRVRRVAQVGGARGTSSPSPPTSPSRCSSGTSASSPTSR